MKRREVLGGIAIAALLPSVPGRWSDPASAADDPARPFDNGTVPAMARDLATRPYAPPDERLPDAFGKADYDAYRTIVFDRDRALWRPERLPFQLQPFHRGFLYKPRVELFEVADGRARPLSYDASAFDLRRVGGATGGDLGFAGFRVTHPLNRPDHFDEVASFLGASYFRALGKGHVYGLSARGLSINTAGRGGEEFPLFRAFWIERPRAESGVVVVHALLDSPSAAGAYRFTIRPGEATVFDVEARITPRADLPSVGVAPLTSMFQFSPLDRGGADDYRDAVHDSDGLLLATARGEVLWRPVHNPRDLQVSVFAEASPRGFGLMQRRRSFRDFGDIEAAYHRRPSAWIEPIGDWGEGAVHLIEIPTASEIHDNVVAFWRPKEPLRARQEATFTYRLHWVGGFAVPPVPGGATPAQFVESRQGGRLGAPGWRQFVLEATGARLAALPPDAEVKAEVTASAGRLGHVGVIRNPETGTMRLSFDLQPGNAPVSEIRAFLRGPDGPLTETWLFRWTP